MKINPVEGIIPNKGSTGVPYWLGMETKVARSQVQSHATVIAG